MDNWLDQEFASGYRDGRDKLAPEKEMHLPLDDIGK